MEEDNNKNSQSRKFKSVKLVWAHYGGKVRDLPKCDKGITSTTIDLLFYLAGVLANWPELQSEKYVCSVAIPIRKVCEFLSKYNDE